jgi:Domain of unknown function (DUF397)
VTTTPQTALSRAWRKSTYSDTAQQCVEVAQARSACLVRDTQDRAAGHVAFSARAWATFTHGIKNGGPWPGCRLACRLSSHPRGQTGPRAALPCPGAPA